MKVRRIWAIVLRQFYLYRRSPSRILDLFYWPTVDLLLWGFVTIYLESSTARLPEFVSFFLGALILWNILLRAQQGISVSFLEDVWARNLVNLLVSPLSIVEYITALVVVSIIKVVIAFGLMSLLAALCYTFNILKLGLIILPLVLNLVALGWAIGLLTMGLILRFGQEAEILAWALAFLFMPVSAVFYPVEVLPSLLRKIALFVPSAHAFEGMRQVIIQKGMPVAHLLWATGLNLVYLLVSGLVFYRAYKFALEKGVIPKIGE